MPNQNTVDKRKQSVKFKITFDLMKVIDKNNLSWQRKYLKTPE